MIDLNKKIDKIVNQIIKISSPERIILFGSRAGSDYTEHSDYDLLVLKKGVTHIRKLAREIYMNLNNIGAPIGVIVVDYDKFDTLKMTHI